MKNIEKLIAAKMQEINSQRERILEAFIAEIGCKPSECEQVMQRQSDGGYIWFVRKRK